MDVISVFIGACLWQGPNFDPLLVKSKSGAWTFVSEEFDMANDKNFVRQTLERGLYKKVRGTLNPQGIGTAGRGFGVNVADKLPLIVFTSPSGDRCIRHPHAHQQVHVNIIVPLFVMPRSNVPEELETYSRIKAHNEPVKALVGQVLSDKTPEWSRLRLEKRPVLMAVDCARTADKMRRKGISNEMARRVTFPQTEVYWHPPPEGLQSVA